MTSALEQLDAIWRTWRLQHDALRVVLRTIQGRSVTTRAPGTLAKTLYEEAESAQSERDIRACQKTAAEFAVLGMWAVFERLLLQRLESECHKMLEEPANTFNAAVTAKVAGDVEYWKIDQRLISFNRFFSMPGLLAKRSRLSNIGIGWRIVTTESQRPRKPIQVWRMCSLKNWPKRWIHRRLDSMVTSQVEFGHQDKQRSLIL